MEDVSLLVAIVCSFKFWLICYGSLLLITDTIFFSWFPTTVFGTVVVTGILYMLRIPPAEQEDVQGFFGIQFRPSCELTKMTNGSGPIEDQPGGLTVRSRLMLMKSPPQMTSTPGKDGAGGNGKHEGRVISEGPLIIVGHRGAGLDAPENSLSAIRECKKRGCAAVEFDVSLTKDKVPVLFHDDNLIRIAGIDRDINDMTWEELQKVDISILHPLGEKFRNERVPTFANAVNLCLSLGMKFIIDLKDDDETVVNAVLDIFQQKKCYSMGIVSSFYIKVIAEIRRRNPKIIGCMAWRPGYFRYRSWNSNWENLEPRYKELYRDWAAIIMDALNNWGTKNLYWWFVGLSAMLCHKDAVTREETYRWMKKGVRIYAWTVNSPLEKLHFVQDVQLGYLTDTLDGGEVNTVTSLQSPFTNPSPILHH